MKKLFALLLVALVFGGSALAFAWWDQLETDETVTVPIGEGVTISVSLEDQTAGNLIPSGAVEKPGDVYSVDIEFEVELDMDISAALDLVVTIDNIEIGGDDTYASLVNATVSTNPGSIQNDPVTVIITVTITMPANQTEYNAVANENITFDVTFKAE